MFAVRTYKDCHADGPGHQAFARTESGDVAGEKRATHDEAMADIRFYAKNGFFPEQEPDEVDEDIAICEACGQPIENH